MAKKSALPTTMEFYQDNTNLKWIILVVSTIISISSIYYTNLLVDELKERERQDVQLFAKALEYTPRESSENLNFIREEIVNKNKSIPTNLTNEKGDVTDYTNIDIDSTWDSKRKNEALNREL